MLLLAGRYATGNNGCLGGLSQVVSFPTLGLPSLHLPLLSQLLLPLPGVALELSLLPMVALMQSRYELHVLPSAFPGKSTKLLSFSSALMSRLTFLSWFKSTSLPWWRIWVSRLCLAAGRLFSVAEKTHKTKTWAWDKLSWSWKLLENG